MTRESPIRRSFFERDVVQVARTLIGLSFCIDDTGGLIVETEAYRHDDPASHSYPGQTLRNRSMFGAPGHAYVYRSYGLHWCFNIVCQKGSGVLIRAIEPKVGIDKMMQRSQNHNLRILCAGPGRLTQALGITSEQNGFDVLKSPFGLYGQTAAEVVIDKRIGITKAVEQPWRFGLDNSEFVSRKFL